MLGFDYGTTNNNGNLLTETITRGSGSTLTQSYAYDGLNRLAVAAENPSTVLTSASNCQTSSLSSNWCEQYGHDPYGNHWVIPPVQGINLYSFTPQSPTNFSGQNQLIIQGSTYDGAGNQQQIAGFQFQYDAENRMTSSTFTVTNPNTVTNYVYDGDGRRVMKTVGGVTTTYVYDAMGQLAAEYGPATDTGTKYVTTDHLASTRLVTDASGSPTRCLDYLPFGEEIGNGTTGHPAPCFGTTVYPAAPGALTDKFTGKERDAETGLDFFGARYMSSAQGRFLSPDRIGNFVADLRNPQS